MRVTLKIAFDHIFSGYMIPLSNREIESLPVITKKEVDLDSKLFIYDGLVYGLAKFGPDDAQFRISVGHQFESAHRLQFFYISFSSCQPCNCHR